MTIGSWRSLAALTLAGASFGEAHAADADTRTVRYAPSPAWVTPVTDAPAAPMPPGAPLRVIHVDEQVRVTTKGQDEYQDLRFQVLAPEGLPIGNLAVTWSPASEEVVVHRLAIVRDGKEIDLLPTQKFVVIQREDNLEQSALTGNLTATIQAAGLQVGDELAFAMTKVRRASAAGERPQGFMQFPLVGARGAYRFRLVEPARGALAVRASADVPSASTRVTGDEREREYRMTDPASAIVPDGAPPRYAITRLVQFSGYPDWQTVSRVFFAPFEAAGRLGADSPVKAEAAQIAASTPDPARRVEASLRLVEDRIRYVYVGLDGGNYRPAHVDETWRRKFGDCKAKTVLLIALLRELGVAAEPVLVASKGGDGADERLPSPSVFDHVVVRATVGGAPVWLDGTRLGDRTIAALDPPPSRWGLPLRAGGAALERIVAAPPRWPTRIEAVEIDASAGFDKPGRYRVQQTLRGDEIFGMRAQLAGLAPADADRMLAAYWRQIYPPVEPTRTGWRFDDANRMLVLSLEGEGKVDWDSDASMSHTHYLFGAGFPPPGDMKRPKDQPQDAAWATDYPAFTCYATTVKLPAPGKTFRWSFNSKPMDRTLGGIKYWRISSFENGVARMVKSRRVDVPEITAKDAAEVNAAIAGFDNGKSYVSETSDPMDTGRWGAPPGSVFGGFEDFAGATPPCRSPSGRR